MKNSLPLREYNPIIFAITMKKTSIEIQEIDYVKWKIFELARIYKWDEFSHYDYSLSFIKDHPKKHCIMTVFIEKKILAAPTFRVKTSLNHPRKGRTVLDRMDIDWKQLERIFKNPRVHTGKGWYNKKKKK